MDRVFRLKENQTTARTEVLAGLTTFLTMAYIIFLQPAILSGALSHEPTGMDFGAVMAATCVAAAVASILMGVWARYPIAQAPGMGENFFFVISVLPAAAGLAAVKAGETTAWQVALGVVFIAGLLFLVLSLSGLQRTLLNTISPSMRNAIAVGIGLFIAFIGLKNAGLITPHVATGVRLNPQFTSPDLLVFFFGLLVTAGLHARKVRGSIVLGIVAATLLAVVLKCSLPSPAAPPKSPEKSQAASSPKKEPLPPPMLETRFKVVSPSEMVAPPPSMWNKTLFKMDLVQALNWTMIPFILIFLFMDLFDTLGTMVGVSEQAGLVSKDGQLPRLRQAMTSDAIGTVAGAALGTSTVTSFIESTAGVDQGGRTGLTAVTAGCLFLVALFFAPFVEMIGCYPPITAPALVIVGSMMMWNVTKIAWSDFTEAFPSFLIVVGVPFTYSIADGLALGFIAYPLVKLLGGRGRDVKWLMYVMAVVLAVYFVYLRVKAG